MTQQWLRKVSLILGDEDGEALNMSELRVAFSVQGGVVLTPKHADILIFNVAPHTAQRIQKEFRCVELQAGYADNAGLIFSGTAIQIRRARLGATDTYLHIVATDGDAAHNFSVVHATLAAGWAAADAHQTLTQSAALYGVTAGYAPEFPATRMPRAKTMFGMSRDYLDALAASMDATCHVEDGQLQVVPNHGYLPGEAVVLNAQTGLIGLPQQTFEGIIARCLLNPAIKRGAAVQIDLSSIQHARYDPGWTAMNEKLPSLAEDGLYKVLYVQHRGDTRGADWTTELICADIHGKMPLTGRGTLAV
ncbi:conserved hypothetical protein [Candidatus Glomeribacter gigasporarum BEG34]|uniref:Bacteriophage protein n=1 Tax=Candidatus Glomeribacter gigasporarum BEG34 TaxID=1070319 RepID=G2JBI9_9BURK|nr:hypothetical protein [Candidatus Glomeribacter gigasporarum]CCD30143.1 conserved hypothetical protein [Candidatus Glomeribacter gigasporarum BEG34]